MQNTCTHTHAVQHRTSNHTFLIYAILILATLIRRVSTLCYQYFLHLSLPSHTHTHTHTHTLSTFTWDPFRCTVAFAMATACTLACMSLLWGVTNWKRPSPVLQFLWVDGCGKTQTHNTTPTTYTHTHTLTHTPHHTQKKSIPMIAFHTSSPWASHGGRPIRPA